MINIKPQIIEGSIIGLTMEIIENEDGIISIHIERAKESLVTNRDWDFDEDGEIEHRGSWIN